MWRGFHLFENWFLSILEYSLLFVFVMNESGVIFTKYAKRILCFIKLISSLSFVHFNSMLLAVFFSPS